MGARQAFSISRGDSSVEPELPPDLPPVSLPQLLAPVDAALLLIIFRLQILLQIAAAAAAVAVVDVVGLRGRRPRRPRPPALRRLDEEGVELTVVNVLHSLLGAPPQRRRPQCRRVRRRGRTPRSEEGGIGKSTLHFT